jgi:hypothetical protein
VYCLLIALRQKIFNPSTQLHLIQPPNIRAMHFPGYPSGCFPSPFWSAKPGIELHQISQSLLEEASRRGSMIPMMFQTTLIIPKWSHFNGSDHKSDNGASGLEASACILPRRNDLLRNAYSSLSIEAQDHFRRNQSLLGVILSWEVAPKSSILLALFFQK